MKIYEFLENEVRNDRMDIFTKFTVNVGKKHYLCNIIELNKAFGNLNYKAHSLVDNAENWFNLYVF